MKRIKLLAMDVDGTLTDGKLHISESGELFKTFDIKDGYAIKELIPIRDIMPVIITGRHSKIVKFRAKELNIIEVHEGIMDKASVLIALAGKYGFSLDEIAFIGDDLSDLHAMNIAGASGCPANAVKEAKAAVDYVCSQNGGEGAVREFAEWLIQEKVD